MGKISLLNHEEECPEGKNMHIIFTVASMAGGGAERVISILANRLVQKENKITIIMTAGDKLDYILDDRIEAVSIGGLSGGSMVKRIQRIRHLRDVFRKHKDAVIVSFGLGSNFYTAAAHVGLKNPLIISERNDPAACPHPHLRNMVFGCADKLVFQTEDAVKCFPEKLQRKGVVIANPISENIMPPYQGEREKTIAAVGRLEPQKNYPLMLKAFAKFHPEFPEYTLHVFGEGYLRDELQRTVQEMGISDTVVFEGFAKDVHSKIKSASMYVLSSDYEGISNALLEAMALGLPVIATDCPIGGSVLCIQNEVNGLLVPVGDEKALAAAMRRLARDQESADQMGREAVKVRERFSEENITRQWHEVISQLTESSKGKVQ